ncbi:MAG TPA: class IV adenylate cyclase [Chitinophagaceae bacterium]|nr:class IV adenylate cyclase [Chitinophagaceae bacterium]
MRNSMAFLNVEIKARLTHHNKNIGFGEAKSNTLSFIRNYLLTHNAVFKGVDAQTDTYFNVPNGRLKLREGNIENNLIWYQRADQAGPKKSHFTLVKVEDVKGLKEALTKANGIKVIVKKKREIYYIQNVKFHIDEVPGLGSFVEIEAGNKLADLPEEALRKQCDYFLKEFGIGEENLIKVSYSDMLMKKTI